MSRRGINKLTQQIGLFRRQLGLGPSQGGSGKRKTSPFLIGLPVLLFTLMASLSMSAVMDARITQAERRGGITNGYVTKEELYEQRQKMKERSLEEYYKESQVRSIDAWENTRAPRPEGYAP